MDYCSECGNLIVECECDQYQSEDTNYFLPVMKEIIAMKQVISNRLHDWICFVLVVNPLPPLLIRITNQYPIIQNKFSNRFGSFWTQSVKRFRAARVSGLLNLRIGREMGNGVIINLFIALLKISLFKILTLQKTSRTIYGLA